MIVWIREILLDERTIVIVVRGTPYYETHIVKHDELYRIGNISSEEWETAIRKYIEVKIPKNSNILAEVKKRMPEFFL